MGPNTIISAPMMNNNESQAGKKLKIAAIIILVFAVCCIGFGIFSSIDSKNKSQEISDLKAKVEEQNKTIEEQNKTIEEQNKTIEEQKEVISGFNSSKNSSSTDDAIKELCKKNGWSNHVESVPMLQLR